MERPLKVATPLLAAFDVVPPNTAPLVPVVMVNVTEDTNVVTVLPPASAAATTGCTIKAVPAKAPAGCFVKTNWDAAPTEIVKGLLVALSVPSVAVRV